MKSNMIMPKLLLWIVIFIALFIILFIIFRTTDVTGFEAFRNAFLLTAGLIVIYKFATILYEK